MLLSLFYLPFDHANYARVYEGTYVCKLTLRGLTTKERYLNKQALQSHKCKLAQLRSKFKCVGWRP